MRTTSAVFLFLFAVLAVAAALTHLGTRSAEADLDDDGVYALRGHHARNVVLGESIRVCGPDMEDDNPYDQSLKDDAKAAITLMNTSIGGAAQLRHNLLKWVDECPESERNEDKKIAYATLEFTTGPGCDGGLGCVDNLSPTGAPLYTHSGVVQMFVPLGWHGPLPDDSQYAKLVLSHELGHTIGFAEIYQYCKKANKAKCEEPEKGTRTSAETGSPMRR